MSKLRTSGYYLETFGRDPQKLAEMLARAEVSELLGAKFSHDVCDLVCVPGRVDKLFVEHRKAVLQAQEELRKAEEQEASGQSETQETHLSVLWGGTVIVFAPWREAVTSQQGCEGAVWRVVLCKGEVFLKDEGGSWSAWCVFHRGEGETPQGAINALCKDIVRDRDALNCLLRGGADND